MLDQWAYLNGVQIDFSRQGEPTDNTSIKSFNGRHGSAANVGLPGTVALCDDLKRPPKQGTTRRVSWQRYSRPPPGRPRSWRLPLRMA